MPDNLVLIRELIPLARAITKGSMDPLFDLIIDGEALLAGRRTSAQGTPEDVAQFVIRGLQERIRLNR